MGIQVIKTNDGLMGIKYEQTSRVLWCDDVEMMVLSLFAHLSKKLGHQAPTKRELEREICMSFDLMAKNGDDVAHFGIFGSLLFTDRSGEDNDLM